MGSLYTRIKERRLMLGMSQAELADALGYSDRSTIAKIEKGVNDLTQTKIESFADILQTTPAYLMGWTDDYYDYDKDLDDRFLEIPLDQFEALKELYDSDLAAVWEAWINLQDDTSSAIRNILPLPENRTYPLLGSIACGEPILAEENIAEYINFPGNIKADFCLRCKGDSMINARIYDGDIVFIRRQDQVENGEIAAVRIGDEATLKRVYYVPDSDRVTLRACNPLFPDMEFEGEALNDMQIIGRAVSFLSPVK